MRLESCNITLKKAQASTKDCLSLFHESAWNVMDGKQVS